MWLVIEEGHQKNKHQLHNQRPKYIEKSYSMWKTDDKRYHQLAYITEEILFSTLDKDQIKNVEKGELAKEI